MIILQMRIKQHLIKSFGKNMKNLKNSFIIGLLLSLSLRKQRNLTKHLLQDLLNCLKAQHKIAL